MSQKKWFCIIRKVTAKDKVIHVDIATSVFQRDTLSLDDNRWEVSTGTIGWLSTALIILVFLLSYWIAQKLRFTKPFGTKISCKVTFASGYQSYWAAALNECWIEEHSVW